MRHREKTIRRGIDKRGAGKRRAFEVCRAQRPDTRTRSFRRETWKDVRMDNGRGVSTIKKDINPKMAEALKIQHEVNKKQSSLL